MTSYDYFDRELFPEDIRLPEIYAVSASELLVGGMGYLACAHVDLRSGAVVAGPRVSSDVLGTPVGDCLRTPTASAERIFYGVATRAAWGAIWRRGSTECTQVNPTIGGPVNSVSVSSDDAVIAIGTGYYVLGGSDSVPAVELWSDDGETCLASRRLPGVVVDRLAWVVDPPQLLAAVGARSQDRGFLAVLDRWSLEIIDIFETASCFVSCLSDLPGSGRIWVVYRDRVEIRCSEDPRELRWSWKPNEKINGAAVDRDREMVLLASGHCIDVRQRSVEEVEPLAGCRGMDARPGGGFFGLSESGVLRTWVPRS